MSMEEKLSFPTIASMFHEPEDNIFVGPAGGSLQCLAKVRASWFGSVPA